MRKCFQGEEAGDLGELGRGSFDKAAGTWRGTPGRERDQSWPVVGSQDFRQEIWPERCLPLLS